MELLAASHPKNIRGWPPAVKVALVRSGFSRAICNADAGFFRIVTSNLEIKNREHRCSSRKCSDAAYAFSIRSDPLRLDRFRFLSVEGWLGHVEIKRLFQLAHKRSQIFVARVQDGAQFRAGCHRLLIGIAGLG